MAVRYDYKTKEKIESRLIELYGKGWAIYKIHAEMVAEDFETADGVNPIQYPYLNALIKKMIKTGRVEENAVVGYTLESAEPVEETADEPEDIEIDLPQIVFNCLVSEEMNNNQKIGIIKGYYEL